MGERLCCLSTYEPIVIHTTGCCSVVRDHGGERHNFALIDRLSPSSLYEAKNYPYSLSPALNIRGEVYRSSGES